MLSTPVQILRSFEGGKKENRNHPRQPGNCKSFLEILPNSTHAKAGDGTQNREKPEKCGIDDAKHDDFGKCVSFLNHGYLG